MSIRIGTVTVTLIQATPDAERHIELCGREAYGSAQFDNILGTRDWIRKRIEGWEHDVLEHASATFRFTGSRVMSHEMVRHRLAAITQRSQRFTESAVGSYIIPPEVKEEDYEEWMVDYASAQAIYDKWRLRYPRQTARYHLPNGAETSVVFTWNFREIRHILEMRWAPKAQPETRDLARQLGIICLNEWPGVFGDFRGRVTEV